jgi:hypothetical protein
MGAFPSEKKRRRKAYLKRYVCYLERYSGAGSVAFKLRNGYGRNVRGNWYK